MRVVVRQGFYCIATTKIVELEAAAHTPPKGMVMVFSNGFNTVKLKEETVHNTSHVECVTEIIRRRTT